MRKTILALVALALFSGCTTNGVYDGKKTAWLVATVIVVGAVAAGSSGGSSSPEQEPNCPISFPDPNAPGVVVCR